MSHCHVVQTIEGLARSRAFLGDGDVLVFFGEAVQLLLTPDKLPSVPCHFMENDVAARGLVPFASEVALLTTADFVALLVHHDKQVAW